MAAFEDAVREWVRPVNGQYPRPWMSSTTDPEHAVVFIVGRNPATTIPTDLVPGRDAFVDALFNRNGQSLADYYHQARARLGKGSSPTRTNIERLTALFEQQGVSGVLETNVICYSTPMSADLNRPAHSGGKNAGQQVFRELLRLVRPRIVIAHGSGNRRDLERITGAALPALPEGLEDGVRLREVAIPGAGGGCRTLVVVIPSLAPPGWNKWSAWAHGHLEQVVDRGVRHIRS